MTSVSQSIRTVLVDDDIAMLKGLQRIISWEEEGFEIVGHAENGRDALKLLQSVQVDLIICDITMPGSTGLDLTREAKERFPGIKSIILTCHEEFLFAKEAVAAQADDYLLKYTLTKEELIGSLDRVKKQIEAERMSRIQMVRAERTLVESRYTLLKRFAHMLLDGGTAPDVAGQASDLELTIPPAQYVAIGFFRADTKVNGELSSIDPKRCFARIEARVSELGETMLLPVTECLDVMLYWRYHTKAYAVKHLDPIFRSVCALSSEYEPEGRATVAPIVTIALADGFVGINAFGAAVRTLEEVADGAFYLSCGTVLTEIPHFSETDAWDLYMPVRGDLRTSLNTGESARAQEIIEQLFSEFDRIRPAPEGVRGVVESILIDVGFVANDAGIRFPIDFPSFPRLGGYRVHLLETVRAFFRALDVNATRLPRGDIERIKSYIDNHLADPIGLNTICELVFMNKSYLSRLFKQEVGETFSEYLMRRRVEKAKRLLRFSDKSIDEITEAIGLENVNHFYRIFKRITGKTPRAFRK